MRHIKSFAVLQTSKVMGAVYFLFGLLVMVPFFLIVSASKGHGHRGSFLMVLIAPVFYAVGAFIFTAIVCWLYNAVAKRIGGIEFEMSGEI
jgi:hypothetical protein